VILGDAVGEQFVRFESCGEEVNVVENGIANVGFGQNGSELRLPDALSKPCAGRTLAKMVLEIVGETDELHALVRGRNGNENRLVEAAADHFDLAYFHQSLQTLEIFWAVFFNPGEQRTGIMETEVDTGMLLECLEEGQVATRVGLFKNMLEVAARLMGVDEQNQMELGRHGDGAFSRETE